MNFLEKLQSASEPAKRRWLVVITAVLMVVVIYVWLAYFNNLIAAFSQQSAPPLASSEQAPPTDSVGLPQTGSSQENSGQAGQVLPEKNSAASPGGASFWQTLKSSVANLYEVFAGKLRALGDILNAPREYIIKPPQ